MFLGTSTRIDASGGPLVSVSPPLLFFIIVSAFSTYPSLSLTLSPKIPYIEGYFHITYTTIATMFIGNAIGFIIVGFVNNRLTDRFGMGRIITAGAALTMTSYAVFIPPPPFPVFPPVYIIIGLGLTLVNAGANGWIAGLPDSRRKLGFLHGAYGTGAASVEIGPPVQNKFSNG